MTDTTATTKLGSYRVDFRLANTGAYARLTSSKIVEASSRSAAIESVPGGFDAEVLRWAIGEREALEVAARRRAAAALVASSTTSDHELVECPECATAALSAFGLARATGSVSSSYNASGEHYATWTQPPPADLLDDAARTARFEAVNAIGAALEVLARPILTTV